MANREHIDWSDVSSAAEQMAGNWKTFDSFAWSRGYDVDDADAWLIFYTSNRDSGLLQQSNEQAINKRMKPFTEGDDADVVIESHGHWAVGHVDGFSLRVRKSDGRVTPAFEEFCRIQQELANYPVLNESDYSDREYEAALENYRGEMWRLTDELPEGWEGKVFSWFGDNGHERCTENTDDRGGWAPKEKIVEALNALGLLPTLAYQPVLVTVPNT